MKFINRKQELNRLNGLSIRPQAGLAVIWGRRRIGKSRLLLEWVHTHKGIYYIADESAAEVQRKYFSLVVAQALPGFSDVDYPDWTSLLTRLARDATQVGWRGPIVIDELPYLISATPELPSILQKFVDHEAKKAKLILAFCGSSQRMMQGAVLDASAPLYGRADELIKLGPISAGYIGQALELSSSREMIEAYSIWGGIPRYWELAASSGASLLENIDKVVLDPMGPLNDEPNRLLLEELPPAISLRPILDAIGLGAHRLSEIASRIGQPPTSLVRPMQRLIELDLVEREVPFGTDEHHSKRVLFKIKDPFIRFWFEVVASRRGFFAQTPSASRRKILKENVDPVFSNAWESLCRQAIPLLSEHLDGVFYQPASRFWHAQSPEFDIVASSLDKTKLFIGEAKWLAKNPTPSWIYKTIDEIKGKSISSIPRNPKAQVVYGLFLPEKPKQLVLPPNVKVLDADDIIRGQLV